MHLGTYRVPAGTRRLFLALVFLAWIFDFSAARAQEDGARHKEIHAVLPPGPVVVDAQLGDWDLSGMLDCVLDPILAPRFTARIAVMYDAEALYVAAHFVDDTPLRNLHDPKTEPDKGWAGDCLQIRLCSDPSAPYPLQASSADSICHITMWYFTPDKQPVLQIFHGMDFHGSKVYVGGESGLAFRVDDDGKGYTLEGKLPWQRLGGKDTPPKGGDEIAMTVQPLWSDAAGDKQVCSLHDVVRVIGFPYQDCTTWGRAIFAAKGNLTPARQSAVGGKELPALTATLPLPDAGAKAVSMGVFDGNGSLVRTLPAMARGENNTGDKVSLSWDGLDDLGNPLPAGDYTVRMLTHRGIGQRWVASVHTAGNPPWETDGGRGAWGGDHGPAIAAASDGQRVYLGWTLGEAGRAVIAVDKKLVSDSKAQRLWGQRHAGDYGVCTTALATDGQQVFAAQDGILWGQTTKGPYSAAVILWDAASGRPLNFPFGGRAIVVSRWEESLKPTDMRTHDDRPSQFHPWIPVKRFYERELDHDFGPQEAQPFSGQNLLGIAVSGDLLYAALYLENKIVVFNWRTGQKVKEIATPRPVGLAATRDGQVLAVSNRRVVRINLDKGETTPFITEGLDRPWGVALDAEGRVYVTDCGAAMQVKVFDANGKPVGAIGKPGGRPWVGRYDPNGMLRPSGITVDADGKIWVAEHDNTPRRVSVWSRDGKLLADLMGPGGYAVGGEADPANPSHVNVHDTLFNVNYETGQVATLATLVRPRMQGMGFSHDDDNFMGRALKFCHTRGKDYLVHAGRRCLVVYRLGSDMAAQPVAAAGEGSSLGLLGFAKSDLPETIRGKFWQDAAQYGFTWVDQNDDGIAQPPELVIEPFQPRWGLVWGAWVDDSLAIWDATDYTGDIWRIPVEKWLPGDVPAYPPPSRQKPLFTALGDRISSVMPCGNSVYILEQKGGDIQTGQGNEWSAVSRYTMDGRRLWAYRRAWIGFGIESPLARPGDVVGALKFIGHAALDNGTTLVAVNGYFGQFNLLSDQGLWVASLCKDNRYGPKADEIVVWPENFSGHFFRNKDTGKVYLMAGDTDSRLWEVTGLDTIRTAELLLVITPADHDKALVAGMKKRGAVSELPPIQMTYAKGKTVDGDLADWDMGQGVTIEAGAVRTARAALACNDERLYIAFDVQDDSPMKNALGDPVLAFKTGDVCDLMLAANPKADPKRTEPEAGDMRLSFFESEGKGGCVLYEPIVGKGMPKNPRTFGSPTGALQFDRVDVIAGAKVAVRRRASGYTLEASVPLKDLGFAPKAGLVTKGDLGVLFSNEGGSHTILRAYYANKDTAIVNDLPSEARLALQKWAVLLVK